MTAAKTMPLPPPCGTMTVTYELDRKVKIPVFNESALRRFAEEAHVDRAYHWREIASDPPTPGLRVQLIHKRDGVAYYGVWREGLDATHWAPLPTFEP